MKLTNILENISIAIKNSLKRFPLTILISTTLVIILILLNENSEIYTDNTKDILYRINYILALGIPLSVCINLIFERKEQVKIFHKFIMYIIGFIFLVLYYFFLLEEINWISMSKYIGLTIFFYLSFAYIPWINKKEGYEYYIIDIMFNFILTCIYSLVLYLGILIIMFTINSLFDVNIPHKFTYYTFLIIAGVFAPSLFLAKIPVLKKDTYKINYPKALKVLLLYIIIPLISIYTIILYVYFLKIIVTRNWPQGLVSHLVLWYSILSVAVIFFITPILKGNKWAYKFKLYFPKIIIPILIMMFISIGIRVSTYGLTENRYYGIVMGLWVTCIMLYFSFKKELKNIIIPVSLAVVVLLSVFGPLSSFSISKFSQNNRLKSILERNQMIKEGDIIAKDDLTLKDKEEISMILKYFNDKHSLKDVKLLDDDFQLSQMEDVFGFSFVDKNLIDEEYFYYYLELEQVSIVDVKGYDYIVNNHRSFNGLTKLDDMTISYDDNGIFKISKDSLLYEKNIKDYAVKILESFDNRDSILKNELNIDESTFVDENNKVKVKFIITNISGHYDYANGEYKIDNVEFIVLIKMK